MGGVGLERKAVPAGKGAREVLLRADALMAAARGVIADHERVRGAVRSALTPLKDELVRRELDGIPVSRLKDVTEGRLRLTALEQAGYSTVRQVLDARRYALQQLPGIGVQSAVQAIAAARQIAEAVEEHVTVRIDPDASADPRTTALVTALNQLVNAGPDIPRAVAAAGRIDGELDPLMAGARPARGRLRMLFAGRTGRKEAQAAVQAIDALLVQCTYDATPLLLAQASTDLLRPPVPADEAWIDFQVRSPDYYSLLAEIAGLAPDVDAAEGFLPTDISGRVRAQRLDDTHRRVSLRGYQDFGARFALTQRRVVLGDEMGLGKTIQAIAALAHLKAEGQTHFLVVCPASVLINWTREIESRSTLDAYRVHGPYREAALDEWLRCGDVAVTTFDGLNTLEVPKETTVGMLVVDEAHYVKNPAARRSRSVARWTARTDHVLFLTGTPMENRVEEFRNLVHYLQPDLVPHVRNSDAVAGSEVFRRAVAPAYLRRNQLDVLTELPELIQVDEWEEFTAADLAAYRSAVTAGNFMAMRRAAYADPEKSAKFQRLLELVREAAENNAKVVVFSFFRDVLITVREALGDAALGPITGSVAVTARQQLVDDFTATPGHAVLLSQIQAGGVGLNMQAASVVILCEPQVKPTMESQAIGRAHRMGQIRRVQVHRLLTADSIDQRMLEILDGKKRLFDAYARRSDTAESTPEAVDISEQSLARQIVAEEQLRLATSATGDEAS
ncbi:DEAD/DEAH box helicase [Streptomyces sp. So13.3]|uniref:DEAD/DEAH box helicase n=1 Tax=unclassified Streptomyces TaxID=2593676 RepID=UPI001106A405|nr:MULTISPECIES: DEAD/DEAH box helicase [unclassified Streptomyces]MCZ4096674.1 DEAD/DEAH box helicase [Streptomyces sp. H39-C1]QNA72591.1 DEAD/DEAH box helicase [Streptomyces sp. So13.3]